MAESLINIGIGDFEVSRNRSTAIITRGLGSCVAVCLYDKVAKVAGMAHIMLPVDNGRDELLNARFADTGVPRLFEAMIKNGAEPGRITVKIAGGARMFKMPGGSSLLEIGERNVEAITAVLSELKLKLVAADTGKDYGRTVEFSVASGELMVKAIGRSVTVI
ncbi:MAG: chemotaxis protein CheD [Candidatus Aquicultor sp.]|nr:chemotaxis protein CheD [Candidatus Aquicultor sp.]